MSKIKIAITGGPSGGKTTLIETLKKEMGSKISVVPEAASILYKGGFPRTKTPTGRTHAQRAIYFTQKEIEDLTIDESANEIIVCDRGSLDSIAYWPETEDDFFKNINSNKPTELNRYEWVIHLDTAALDGYDTSNPIRTETHQEAMTLNEKIKMAWNGHKQRIIITSNDDFLMKMMKSIQVVKYIKSGKRYEEILKILSHES